jgi:HK97 family phage major capsid protein
MRTEIRIEVLREAFAENLQYAFLAFLRADIGVVRPQSFAQITGITPGE